MIREVIVRHAYRLGAMVMLCGLLTPCSAENLPFTDIVQLDEQAAVGLPSQPAILAKMTTANQYFRDKWPDPGAPIVHPDRTRPSNIWTRATYYEGLMALHDVAPQPAYYDYAVAWGQAHNWEPAYGGTQTRDADNQCCGQTYIDLYMMDPQPQRIAPIKQTIDNMVNGSKADDWWWIDALQMAMPVFARLGVVYDDDAYFEKMYDLYIFAKEQHGDNGLYNPEEGLWWRDKDFDPPYKTPGGENCYWSRGNGWVFAALVRVLDIMPPDAPHRSEYIDTFKAMADALLPIQRDDGFWNVSLVDPTHYGGKETSGTAFFVYGFAWGVRKGLLDEAEFLPAAIKGWNGMANEALHPNGFLGYVQGTGKQPGDGQPVTYYSVPNFEDYGLGAFLLAGAEMVKLAGLMPDGWNFPPAIDGVTSSVQISPEGLLAINAIVYDDGLPDPPGEITMEWTVEDSPEGADVVFDPDRYSENVFISFSKLGQYTLKFAVSDSDLVTERHIAVSVSLPTYKLQGVDFVTVGNGDQVGPDQSRRATQANARNHEATRRQVSYYQYDISGLKEEGKVFANSHLMMNLYKGTENKNLYVYAVKDGVDDFTLQASTWMTVPGLQNTPPPPLGSQITIDTLDKSDLSPLLLAWTRPPVNAWQASPVSPGLNEILNADTNGIITLMFITYDPQNSDFEIYSPTSSVKYTTGAGESLGGIILCTQVVTQKRATNPSPAINADTTQMLSELSWANPAGVGDITCDVYIGIGEPNYLASNYGYDTLATGLSGNSVSLNGYPIVGDTTYNWIVDVHDSGTGLTTRGYLWTFNVLNNLPPTVVVTDPVQYIWLNNDGDPESATVVFEAVGDDDGIPEPLTYLWEQVGTEPAVVAIDPSDVAAIGLILPQTGAYTFRVTVSDGELSATTGAQVFVGADPCAAAQAKPGYAQNPADFNNDCYVNIEDFAFFAGQWLECNPGMDAPCVE